LSLEKSKTKQSKGVKSENTKKGFKIMSKKFKIAEEPKIFYHKNRTSRDLSLMDSCHYNKLLLNAPRKKDNALKRHS
jgi:hypothetical protein